MKKYDIVIIGAGIYGLYIANIEELKDKKILVIEIEDDSFKRASFINQARLHNGYHYPRSIQTACDAHNFFEKFNDEFSFAINSSFKNIYAIAKDNSLTTAKDFELFCKKVGIPIVKEKEENYFKNNMVEAAYSTKEYTFDALSIKKYLTNSLTKKNVDIMYSIYIKSSNIINDEYQLILSNEETIWASTVINTTYASINCVNKLFDIPLYDIKYELCEVALGKGNKELSKYSFTIMDGNYFSVMPFSPDGVYSLTSVHYTPHETSYDKLPHFSCQDKNANCSCNQLRNCNDCKNKPCSKHKEMEILFNDYLLNKFSFEYDKSIFAIKPILKSCESDDARPTIIKKFRSNPTFIACLSGKVSTIYIMKDFVINNIER